MTMEVLTEPRAGGCVGRRRDQSQCRVEGQRRDQDPGCGRLNRRVRGAAQDGTGSSAGGGSFRREKRA